MEDKQVNIVLFGPPGAGKGTQADNLVKNYKFFKVSTGDLLRKEIEKKSFLGKQIKNTIDQGHLVTDDIIDKLVEEVLSKETSNNNLIFDGYPRNLNQAKYLDKLHEKYNKKISCVLSLKVNQQIIIKRILGRKICTKCGLTFNDFFNPENDKNHPCGVGFLSKRSDDNEKTISKRFTTYTNETMPILNYYKKQNLLSEIDGMNGINEIYKEIQQIIDAL